MFMYVDQQAELALHPLSFHPLSLHPQSLHFLSGHLLDPCSFTSCPLYSPGDPGHQLLRPADPAPLAQPGNHGGQGEAGGGQGANKGVNMKGIVRWCVLWSLAHKGPDGSWAARGWEGLGDRLIKSCLLRCS